MPACGLAGRIQVAESTMRRASPAYRFTERVVGVKGMGQVRAYLLDATQPDLT